VRGEKQAGEGKVFDGKKSSCGKLEKKRKPYWKYAWGGEECVKKRKKCSYSKGILRTQNEAIEKLWDGNECSGEPH